MVWWCNHTHPAPSLVVVVDAAVTNVYWRTEGCMVLVCTELSSRRGRTWFTLLAAVAGLCTSLHTTRCVEVENSLFCTSFSFIQELQVPCHPVTQLLVEISISN